MIHPGVALNAQGELIALSPDGQADLGPNPSGDPHTEVPVPVQLPLASHTPASGTANVYVTIQYSEILRATEGSGGRQEQVPLVRLQNAAGNGAYVDDGSSIILAIAEINSSGDLIALKNQDSAVLYRRRLIGQFVEELRIQRSEATSNTVDGTTSTSLDETLSGKIGPNDNGGLQITVPTSTDSVVIAREDGGNFANLNIHSSTIVDEGDLSVKDGAGRDVFTVDGNVAAVTIGTNGNEGDLSVKDGAGRDVFTVDGNVAAVTIGTNGNEGDLSVKDGAGQNVFTVDGNVAAVTIGSNGNEGDLSVKDGAGQNVFTVDGNVAAVTIGSNGNEGDLFVKDGAGRNVFTVDGNGAAVTIGSNGNEGDLYVKDGAGRNVFTVDGNGAAVTIGSNGNEGDLYVKDGAGRTVFNFDSNAAALYVGANGNEGDLQIRDGSGRTVFNFNGDNAALYLGASGNAGDLVVQDSAGSESAKIQGNTGKFFIKRIDPYGDTLDIDARFLRIHGYDLSLDGRSGGNKRALVDSNNRLVINWANDYAYGVETPGDFKVGGTLRVGNRIIAGNPARYVVTRWLYADNGTVTQEVNLGSTRRVFAFVSIVGMDPRHDFDQGDCFAVDIFQIDGRTTGTWIFGGAHFGSSGSNSNFKTPVYQGSAQRILFRARSWQDASVFALGIVFYE